MKCLICSSDSAGEVCNKCSRLEKILYQKEWTHKEGMIIKKTEDFRIVISNMRISGRVAVGDNPKGLNARLDNMSHYLLNIKECTETTYQGKKTVMVVLENNSGENTKYTRYCFLPGFEEADQFIAAIADGKQKAETIADRIRQTSGISTGATASSATPTSSAASAAARAAVTASATPKPTATPTSAASAPKAAPTSYDTVALSNVATDINEFETKIKKLKVLRDNGILSEEEYLAEKKKLVSIF